MLARATAVALDGSSNFKEKVTIQIVHPLYVVVCNDLQVGLALAELSADERAGLIIATKVCDVSTKRQFKSCSGLMSMPTFNMMCLNANF